MNNGQAVKIFKDIKSDAYTENEKAWAIHQVLSMQTHNGITKDDCLTVIMWLWHRHYTFEETPILGDGGIAE